MKNIVKYIAHEIAEDSGFLLINIIFKGSNKNPEFVVFIDSENGICADDCANFSRQFKKRLESTDFSELDYKLIVSSPGIDEPLKSIVQFRKHIGREFKLSYLDDERTMSIEAKLLKLEGENLIFAYKKGELQLNFNKIKKAIVKTSF